jgi:hypothetical protein
MAIDPNTLEWGYRSFIDDNSEDQKANYSFNFNSGGQEFTFIPKSVIEKGVDTGDKNYVFPSFLNQDNLTKLGETGQYVDLKGVSWYGDYLKDNVGASTEGFLVPAGSFDFGTARIVPNNVRGVGTTSEGLSYILETPAGKLGQYVASDGKTTTLTKTKGSSFLGNALGSWVDNFTEATGISDVAGEVNDFFQTDLGKAIKLASLASSVYSLATAPATAGNLAPVVDAGGPVEYLPSAADAAGAGGAISSPVYSPDLPVGTPLPPLPEPTLDEIISEMAPVAPPPAEVGPELLGEAGGNTFPLDAPLEGEIPLGDAITPVSNPVYDYGDATPAEITSAKTAMAAKGLTFKDALNYVRGGLLVNALVGDPLGLGGSQPTGGGGPTGFEQVPIPADWRSPTYAASSAPIDLSSIFTDQNLLAGTQWQGLPQQQNVSFNDIFASGQQRTPMGQPVDINQIVSAILGQNTASQKPA